MGNSTSTGKRHNSGEDSGPNITARGLFDSDSFDVGSYKRPRAHTVSLSQGQPISPEITTLSRKLPTVFKWEGGGKEVYIAGSYDNWKGKIPMVKSQSDFYTIIDLPEGEYQYKFFVDGQWVHDQNEEVSKNQLGTENNIINVQKSDFEVFEALDIDSVTPTNSSSSNSTLIGSSSLRGEYGQDIPSRRPNEKHSGPPFLPPHLLQVILNKDTPAHCEPTLLPEPNHVMLNHLYALSIKDGVMVLSATHRFKKKFVTTLLYKPT